MSITATTYKSVCSGCEMGCGILLTRDRNGKIQVEGNENHPVNKGMLCSKGLNLHYRISDTSQRLLSPLMRWGRTQPLKQVDWDLAFIRSAAVIRAVIEEFGADAVGVYLGGHKTIEEYYLAYKLFHGFLGIRNIETTSLIKETSLSALTKMTGSSVIPVTMEDIDSSECFVIAGLDIAVSHPVLFKRIQELKNKNKAIKIIYLDQQKSETAALADFHIQVNPGTEIIFYNAIGRFLIESGMADKTFLNLHTEGFDEYLKIVFERSISEAAELCDVQVEDIINVAQVLGQVSGFISIMKAGKQFNSYGEKHNLALLNLYAITGKSDKPGSGPFLIPTNEIVYGVDGKTTFNFPLTEVLSDQKEIENIADFWGVKDMKPLSGSSAADMFDGLLSGHFKMIILLGTNPLKDLPDARNVEVALKNARFVVVQDFQNSSLTKYADVVLPSSNWFEKEGTVSYPERRISYTEKALNPPGEAMSDLQILVKLAKSLGFEKSFRFKSEEDVFNEYAAISRNKKFDLSGLTYEHIRNTDSEVWPFTETGSQKNLYRGNTYFTINKKLRITPVPDYHKQTINNEYSLVLSIGSNLLEQNSTGEIRDSGKSKIEKPVLKIHELDALTRNISDGDICEIYNDSGNVNAVACVTGNIKSGVIQLPEFWTRKLLQPAGVSETKGISLKSSALHFPLAEVKRYSKKKERLIVIGAGASSFRFLQRYRELNVGDDLLVFSKEKNQFYNRVLLPEYISGNLEWKQLVKFNQREIISLDLEMFPGTGISSIDRQNKTVTDDKGRIHQYDKLVLATGSRPNLPAVIDHKKEGIFTMRQREDAEKLISSVDAESVAVIVGGGLLGIEIADALSELGVSVSIVQRSSRLMDRQLDTLASELLNEELLDRGIKVYFNDEILSVKGGNEIEGVKLKSGKSLDCDVLIYAIGTLPNIELARTAGLKCNRGIIVSNYLQTSDPDIFAMGEIAEHLGVLYGITAAAEEQAEMLADFLNGNEGSEYMGSVSMNILKVKDLNLCSIGVIDYPKDDKNYQAVVIEDKAIRYYKKCIIYRDILVGAILIGDKTEFNEFKKLIREAKPLGEKRKLLLKPGGFANIVESVGKIICSCNNVTDVTIEAAIETGMHTVNEICKATGAGTGCGGCKSAISKMCEMTGRELVKKQA